LLVPVPESLFAVIASDGHFSEQADNDLRLPDGSSVICTSRADAELVLDAVRRFFEGDTGRKLPRQTLAALERAGMTAANSVLYRSALHQVEEQNRAEPVAAVDRAGSPSLPGWLSPRPARPLSWSLGDLLRCHRPAHRSGGGQTEPAT